MTKRRDWKGCGWNPLVIYARVSLGKYRVVYYKLTTLKHR